MAFLLSSGAVALRPFFRGGAFFYGEMHDAQRHMNYDAVFYFGPYKYMLASGLLKGTVDVLPKLSMGQCHHDNGKSYGRPAHATRPGGAGL